MIWLAVGFGAFVLLAFVAYVLFIDYMKGTHLDL